MVWYLGKTIRESFATGEAGETFAALSRKVDGTDTVFTPTFTGSDRAYEATYVPTVTGVHTSAWQGSVSGAVVAFTWDVITAAQADPAAALASTVAQVDTLAGRLTDARASRIDLIGAGTAVTLSPVSTDATTLTIDLGADYTGSDAIAFTEPSAGWDSLSGASVTLSLLNRVNAAILTLAGTVTSSTPGSQEVAFALTSGQSATLRAGVGVYKFKVMAVLAGGADRLLAAGTVTVRA